MNFVCKRMINNIDDNGIFDYIATEMEDVVAFAVSALVVVKLVVCLIRCN